MGIPRIDTGPMTVEEFYAFTDTRPDDEKWELIDGEPILNASPVRFISSSRLTSRRRAECTRELSASLLVDARSRASAFCVSDTKSAGAATCMIVPRAAPTDPATAARYDSDAVGAVRSACRRRPRRRDLKWKRAVYTDDAEARRTMSWSRRMLIDVVDLRTCMQVLPSGGVNSLADASSASAGARRSRIPLARYLPRHRASPKRLVHWNEHHP